MNYHNILQQAAAHLASAQMDILDNTDWHDNYEDYIRAYKSGVRDTARDITAAIMRQYSGYARARAAHILRDTINEHIRTHPL